MNPKEEAVLNLIKEGSEFANYFFKKVSDLKWFYPLKKEGYFNPDKAPGPKPSDQAGYFVIPEWNILQYLERVSRQADKSENERYINELLEIIKNVTEYHIKRDKALDNYRTWFYFTKILINLPTERIPLEIMDLIPIWLDSKFDTSLCGSEIGLKLLPKFLTDDPEDIEKAEKIIEAITAIKTVILSGERAEIVGKGEEKRFIVDPYWIGKIFKKHADSIGKKCSVKVIIDLNQKIKNLLTKADDGTYHSFYEEKEYPAEKPLELLTLFLKRVLLVKSKTDIESTKKILKEYINDEYLYFLKMTLFVIGQNMDKHSDLFWEILDTEIGKKIMEKSLYMGDELRILLKNLQDLSDKQKVTLKEKIEESAKQFEHEEEAEKYKAFHKQEIYEALSHDQYFKSLYDEMKITTQADVALHPAIGKSEVRVGPGPSPLTKEEIVQMSNNELAEYMETFKTRDFWRGPTVGGLADVLAATAKEMPEKFINNLSPFKNISFIYVYKILQGIKDAWNEKKSIECKKLFQFLKEYIDREVFWENRFISRKDNWPDNADCRWIIGIVTDLIQDGTRDDAWAFSEAYFENAEEILFLILNKLKADEEKEITDHVTYTLNTAYGRAITAFILLSLRIARVNDNKGIEKDIKWSHKYKAKYDEILNKNVMEGFTNLGRYLPNLNYLDKEWVKSKIKNLESQKGDKYWEAFMQGYLSIERLYNAIYKIMRNHYKFAIDFEFKEEQYSERFVDHVSIAYLRGIESINDSESLFKRIVDNFKHEQINAIIGLFWMQREYINENGEKYKDIRKRILDFWGLLYEKYYNKESLKDDDKKVLSNLVKLAAILPEINDEYFKWLMLSSPYVNIGYNASFLIEYLNELKDKGDNRETAKYIGKIYLRMLKTFPIPNYDQKHIISIVDFLYKKGEKEILDKICDIYSRNGYLFLRNICEKYSDD